MDNPEPEDQLISHYPGDLGKLPPGNSPVCAARQVNKEPAAFPRVPTFGAGGVGFYAGEPKGQ